jgi:DNA-binding response OmpR family regulator
MACILIAEDEPRIARFIEKGLRAQGYDVVHTPSGDGVVDILCTSPIDLLLLDLGLPGLDGTDVLEAMRGQGIEIPVIVLTARDDLSTKVASLDAGADDYITKPFRFDELLARIRARLRTSTARLAQAPHAELLQLQHCGISMNLRARQVFLEGSPDPIDLTDREFRLLELFLSNPMAVHSREQILDHVWGYGHDPQSNIVDVYIGYLRRKIDSHRIETIRGIGYRLSDC